MKRWLSGLAVVLILAGSSAEAQTGKDGSMAKLTHSLIVLHGQYTSHLAQRSAAPFRSNDPLVRLVSDRVTIDAVASGDVEALKADLMFLGMQEAVAFGSIVSGQLPISAIPALASLPSLRFVQSAMAMTNAGNVTSQGDQAMRSNVARTTFGVDGTGVTVGVLSDSFDCLGSASADVASGDLSPVSVLQEEAGCISGSDEGRAMLQIVHDIAPGAGLSFASAFNGMASFAANIQALAAAGAKVIVDDVIYFAEPMFQDGIIGQAVDNAVAGGAVYFSSAGNQARQSYQDVFRPGTPFAGGTPHDFTGGDVFQRITLANGQGFIMSFQWDQPFFSVSGGSGSQNDLDVYVFNAAGTQIVGGSFGFNRIADGGSGDPVEVFSFTNTTGVTADFNIMLVNFSDGVAGRPSGPNPGLIKYVLFNFGGTIQEFATNSGTVFGHANAVGAEAVGATAYFNTPAFGVSPPTLESFSSSGATPVLFDLAGSSVSDPRAGKPEIVAPDGVDTTFFGSPDFDGSGFPNFFGTSAAAPHAAAVTALLLQSEPTLTPANIYGILASTAIDMGTPGFDNDSGFGLIQADAALAAVSQTVTLSNISTRGPVQTTDNVMIGGFIIEGSTSKTVLVRGRGPSMGGAPFNIPGVLADPSLQLFSGQTVIAQNDNWQDEPNCPGFSCGGASQITATGLDPCQPNPMQSTSPAGCAQESAILITLPPGPYTAIQSGVGGQAGVGLVEVFEVDSSITSKLVNISTRGPVQTTDNVMIGGFIIEGSTSKTVLVRGRGPSMGGAPFNITGVLANPFLQLFSGQTVIAQNDNWQDAPNCPGFSCGGAPQITATGLDPCQPNPGQSMSPPGCAQESAIVITLPAGAYTAILSGVGGGTGVGLVEVFEVN